MFFVGFVLFLSSSRSKQVSSLDDTPVPSLFNITDTLRVLGFQEKGLVWSDDQLTDAIISEKALGISEPFMIFASSFTKVASSSEDYIVVREYGNSVVTLPSYNAGFSKAVRSDKVRIRIATLNYADEVLIVRDSREPRPNVTMHKLIEFATSLDRIHQNSPNYDTWHLWIPTTFRVHVLSTTSFGDYQYVILDRPSYFRSIILLRIKGASFKKGSDRNEVVAYTLSCATRGAQFFDILGEKFVYIFTHEKESEIIRLKIPQLNELLDMADHFCNYEIGPSHIEGFILVDFQSWVLDHQVSKACKSYPGITTVIDRRFSGRSILNSNILNVARDIIWIHLSGKIQKRYLILWHNNQVYRCHDSDQPDCILIWTFESKSLLEVPLYNSYRLDRLNCVLEMSLHSKERRGPHSKSIFVHPFKLKITFLDCSLFDDCLDCELYGASIPCVWEYDEARKSSKCKRVLSGGQDGSQCLRNHRLVFANRSGTRTKLTVNFPGLKFRNRKFKIRFHCLHDPWLRNEGDITVLDDHHLIVIWPSLEESCDMKVVLRFEHEGGQIEANRLFYWDLTKSSVSK